MRYLVLLSCLLTAVSSSFTLHHNPILADNQCQALALKKHGVVTFEVILHEYCTHQQYYNESYVESFVKDWIQDSHQHFQWETQVIYKMHNTLLNNCSLDYDENTDSTDSVVTLNLLVSPQDPKRVAEEIAQVAAVSDPYASIAICLEELQDQHCSDFATNLRALRPPSTTIFSSSELRTEMVHRITSALSCGPGYHQAIPIEYYDTNGTLSCQCQCAVDYVFKWESASSKTCVYQPAIKQKKESNFDDLPTCIWNNKCFSVSIGSSQESSALVANDADVTGSTCSIHNLFGNNLISIPTPWDNYVAGTYNGMILSSSNYASVENPRIEITLVHPNGRDTTTMSHSWVGFCKNQAQILNSVTFKSDGIYTLSINAKDWTQDASCTASIVIQDNFRPYGEPAACPAPLYHNDSQWPFYTNVETVLNVQSVITSNAFKNSRLNDACGLAGVASIDKCDIDEYHVQYLDTTTGFTKSDGDDNWASMTLADNKYLAELDITQRVPGQERTKCVKRHTEFGEDYESHSETCDAVSETSVTKKCEQSKQGAACVISQCITARSTELFEANVTLRQSVRDASRNVSQHFDNIKHHEIHVTIPETHVGETNNETSNVGSYYLQSLSQWFSIRTGVTPVGKSFKYNDVNLNTVIQCRYRVIGQEDSWNQLSNDNSEAISFITDRTEVAIECWSRIGMLHQSVWTVVVHPHTELDICGEFSKKSFFSTLERRSVNHHHQYCNVPSSDFVQLTTEFKIKELLQERHNASTVVPYDYSGKMQCDFYYLSSIGGTRSRRIGSPLTLVNTTTDDDENTHHHEISHYAIDLISDPVTRPVTAIEFDCRISFNSRVKKSVKNIQHCQTFLELHDCDAPVFDVGKPCKDCDPRFVNPMGSCAGKQIIYKGHPFGGARLVTDERVCCDACGDKHECFGLLGALPYSENLGRCEKANPVEVSDTSNVEDLLSMQQQGGVMTYYNAAAGGCVVLVSIIMFVVKKRRNHHDSSKGDNYYQPLL